MRPAAVSRHPVTARPSVADGPLEALLLAACALALSPGSVIATTSYQLNLGNYIESSSSPVTRDTTFLESAPGYQSDMRCAGLATARRAAAFTRIVTDWQSVNHGGSANSARAHASADDFVITGPAGPTSVAGTMYFRVAANLSFQGGYPGPVPDFIEESHLYFSVAAAQVNQAYGGYTHSNSAGFTGGYGPLAGETDPNIDVVFPVSGSYPVGTPFSVELHAEAGGGTALDNTNSPASIVADGGGLNPWRNRLGLWLGDASGHVMDLPPGYSVASPDWDVTGGTTAVGDERPGPSGMRMIVAPNPLTAATWVSFEVEADGHHQLAIFDLAGRNIRTLHDGWKTSGWHRAAWDGRDAQNQPAPLGVYFAVLSGNRGAVAQRLAIVR